MARVDDRLIHGQVIHGWVPSLGTEVLVVADVHMCDNEDEQFIARMAIPDELELHFLRPDRVAGFLQAEDRPTVVLFRTPMEARAAMDAGFAPTVLNLGNLHFEAGKVQLRKTFCCSEPELDALREIAARGVELEYQPAPDLKCVPIDLQTFSR